MSAPEFLEEFDALGTHRDIAAMVRPLPDLARYRARLKLTSQALAAKCGVTTATWSRWETGSRAVPGNRVLEIEALTGVCRHTLRPDIFGPELEGEGD